MSLADYYELLGVSRSATEDEIKKAYRRLAREHHPDITGGNKDSEERFKEVTRAYETLRDPEKRRMYDTYGSDDPRMAQGSAQDIFGAGFGDIFETFFGQAFGNSPFGQQGPRRGGNAEVTVVLTFEEAVFGVKKDVTVRLPVVCGSCAGSGAQPGTSVQTCGICKGAGQVRRVQQSFLGRVVTTVPCDKCRGEGKIITQPCKTCRGEGITVEDRSYVIDIPQGVDEGTTLRLPGKGPAASHGGLPGDLYVRVAVSKSDRFTRDGINIRAQQSVSIAQASLGTSILFTTLDGEETISIAPGTQSGTEIVLKNKGVPQLQGRRRGDLIVTIVVVTPIDLNDEEIGLLRRLAEIRGEVISEPVDQGIFSKLKSAWK